MGSDEIHVNIHISEIVNQNSQTPTVVTRKQSINEGRLACPEVTTENGDRYGLSRRDHDGVCRPLRSGTFHPRTQCPKLECREDPQCLRRTGRPQES